MPLRRKSMLCQCVSEQTIAVAEPLNAQALRLNAFYANALPLHCIASQNRCSAQPRQHVARALHRYSMPLLRYARLDLSVQRLSDTILVIATAKRYLSTPLQNYLCLASAPQINSAS